ncbi:MAG TPA: glycosyltransferase [Acidimicrobiales bacterium]|nr:glycosyltransferase [Acidimicrobiales bacterium]
MVHLASPVELSVPIDRLLPPEARAVGTRVCVTVFDLIPLAMPEVYLEDPGLRRRYLARIELLRNADRILAISRHVAAEVTSRLGVAPARVLAVPLVPAAGFRPPFSRETAVREAMDAVPGLRSSFVLYTGGSDGRKNVEGLLQAWALLPEELRRSWQLVVAGSLPPLHRHHLEVMAATLGFGDGLLCTGFVDDAVLVALNQSAGLFVFPTLAEGFGLPVAEALACGTPVIGGDNTSIVELLPDEARFDASSPPRMSEAIARGLTDDAYRRRILAVASERPDRTWDDVAAETLAAYPPGVARPRRPDPRLRLAFVSPLPPQPGGVATYSARLLGALRARDDLQVEAFVDGPPHHRAEVLAADARPLAALDRTEALGGRYDAVVYSLGNSEFHTGALAQLVRRPGIVLAHDVRLTNLHRFAAWQHPEATPGGFAATLHRMYEGRLPAELGRSGGLTDAEVDRWGLLMARDVIAASTRFVTTSDFAADLARLDARPEHRHRITTIPFPISDSPSAARVEGPPVVVSFGVLNPLKQGPLLVRALAACGDDAVRLVFVGPSSDADTAAVRDAASEAGVGGRVEVTGAVDHDGYRHHLGAATVAVQLRASTNGESSAAVGDCLAAGIPTVVTDIGANRALPRDAVVAVAADVSAPELAAVLGELLHSPGRRASLGTAARKYAEAHSFADAADALYRLVSSPA